MRSVGNVTAARVILLLVAVAGAIVRPVRLPAFVAPVVCAGVALASGLVSLRFVGHSLGPLAGPLGFLLAAIPLAVLLDHYGYFEQVAGLFGGGRLLVPGLWCTGVVTVAVLNLDAAVVLLTPLYVRIARQNGRSERWLGFQPVLLALLASSFLPVSNLTNLIAASTTGIGPLATLAHLGPASLAACGVGYLCYRRAEGIAEGSRVRPDAAPAGEAARSKRVLVTGSLVVAVLLVGFVAGPSAGIEPWEAALAADVVLVVLTAQIPWRSVPWDTALVAASLGVLAAGAARGLPLRGLFTGTGPLALLREAAAAALGANVVNNLPALLVALPFVKHPGHASCSLWPMLFGVNAGPSLLVTGSLASLLWFATMRRLGTPVSAFLYLRMGVAVALPAALVGVAVLIATAPAFGCG